MILATVRIGNGAHNAEIRNTQSSQTMKTAQENITLCIYRKGNHYLETASSESPPRNFSGETFDDMIERLNSELADGQEPYQVMPIDDACEMIYQVNRAKYCGPWKEIDEETWWDALEVLPPEKWQTVSGVEIFRLMEYLTGTITAHYARLGTRYFVRNISINTPYKTIADEVANLA
jgi:hypothetical protein